MRPRLVLVVSMSPLEWRIREQLEEWADLAVLEREARLPDELDARDWDSCVLVGDEFGALNAMTLAEQAPERVAGLAIGHACLYRPGAHQHDVEPGIWDAYKSLARLDYRSFARSLTQVSAGSYGDDILDQFLETIPHERLLENLDLVDELLEHGSELEPVLRRLNRPLLFAHHTKCLLWTKQGFDAAVAAFPTAETVATEDKPSISPEFAEALREFCEST
jgi:pimeloyl-ACP methyl ester carboxylesterase